MILFYQYYQYRQVPDKLIRPDTIPFPRSSSPDHGPFRDDVELQPSVNGNVTEVHVDLREDAVLVRVKLPHLVGDAEAVCQDGVTALPRELADAVEELDLLKGIG